jgi:hypothetical protein
MKWTLTTKTQSHGLNTEAERYEIRVTRAGRDLRVSFQNLGPGNVREGHFLVPVSVAQTLGRALLLACGSNGDRMNVVCSVDEQRLKQ